jgi:CRP/FNR family cyclic AMP-dependent transcriptional regulator
MDVSLQLLALAPEDVRRRLEPRLRPLRARKGQTVMSVGAYPDDVLFIVDGEAEVALHAVSGREVSLRRLGPGDIFGDLAAVDGLPRSASVVALSELRLSALTRSDFLACISSSPEAALWFARRLVGEVRRLTDKVFELSALSVQARLLCELLRLARAAGSTGASMVTIRPAPTHAVLASRIAAQREAVSRELQTLAGRGLLRHDRRTLEFPDLEALEREVSRVVGVLAEPIVSRPGLPPGRLAP